MMKILFDWFINVILMILFFKKRDDNIWLFGSWNGERYNDNSKYLFEYVVANYPNIDAIWITKNKEVKNKLLNKNRKCYLSNELIARKLRLNAGFVFFTNGLTDLGNYDLCHGSMKIYLSHGMNIKKLYYATNKIKKRKNNFIRIAQYYFIKIYNDTHRDITIATSKKTKEFLIESFEVPSEKVLITGLPRNDILFDKIISDKLKNKLGHKSKERFILYIPTWRNFGQNESFLDNIIDSLFNDNTYMNELKEQGIKLYIKPHPRIRISSISKGNVIILNTCSNLDTQELLASADSIITDYSGVFIDYALRDKPIHFFVPDLDDYKTNGNDLFLNFEEFTDHIIKNLTSFKETILDKDKIYSKQGIKNTEKINSIFNSSFLEKGKYCETLISVFENNNILKV